MLIIKDLRFKMIFKFYPTTNAYLSTYKRISTAEYVQVSAVYGRHQE